MTDSHPIRVLCVDDNDLVGEALNRQLTLAGGFEWVGHMTSADGLVEQVQQLNPHIVLLDIDMPGIDPFDALAELTHTRPDVPVLMLTGHMRPELIDRSIEAGAAGYISKNEDADHLLPAIRRAAQGEFVLGPFDDAAAQSRQRFD